jgi:hypothetical protein
VEWSAFRALPKIDRTLTVLGTSEDDLADNERQLLLSEVAQGTLLRLRLKALPFLASSPTDENEFTPSAAIRSKTSTPPFWRRSRSSSDTRPRWDITGCEVAHPTRRLEIGLISIVG